jgi:predicted dehydrogenase
MTLPRIGLIGLGVISRFYLAALERAACARLVAVCDPDENRLAAAPAQVPRYRDHRELLRAADLDAVVVNVPNDLHYPVCRDALAAGRAVCVEKPLATDPQDGHHLAQLSQQSGAVLFTSFHRRYNREVNALRRRIASGAPIASLTVRYEETIEEHAGRDRWYLDPKRCGGGCVADNGPNAFDLVRLFLGDVRVTGATVHRDAQGVDRQAQVLLNAPSGARARVVLDGPAPASARRWRCDSPTGPSTEPTCSRGIKSSKGPCGTNTWAYYGTSRTSCPADARTTPTVWPPWSWWPPRTRTKDSADSTPDRRCATRDARRGRCQARRVRTAGEGPHPPA